MTGRSGRERWNYEDTLEQAKACQDDIKGYGESEEEKQ